MQQKLLHPNRATAIRPGARFLSWLTACFLGLTLAACGGGGETVDAVNSGTGGGSDGGTGDGSGGGASPGNGGGTGDTANAGTFVAAAGPLCTKRNSSTGHCIQPTSSSIDEKTLLQTISEPGGQVIDFDAIGWTRRTDKIYGTSYREGSYLRTTYPGYSLKRWSIQAGRNRFTVDGRRYWNPKNSSIAGQIEYTNERNDANIILGTGTKQGHGEDSWGLHLTESQILGEIPNSIVQSTDWYSGLRLLTDQADAPQARKVTYVGTITAVAGDRGQINENSNYRLSTAVTYEAVLDTATGKLSGVRIDYTDPESERRTRLELPEMRFQNSRLDRASHELRIRTILYGPGDDLRPGAPLSDTSRFEIDFGTTDGLEGEIIGKQAARIQIVGANYTGVLRINLMRKDLVGKDFIINVPLAR